MSIKYRFENKFNYVNNSYVRNEIIEKQYLEYKEKKKILLRKKKLDSL